MKIKNGKRVFHYDASIVEGHKVKTDFVKSYLDDSFFKWYSIRKRKAVIGAIWDECKKKVEPESG